MFKTTNLQKLFALVSLKLKTPLQKRLANVFVQKNHQNLGGRMTGLIQRTADEGSD